MTDEIPGKEQYNADKNPAWIGLLAGPLAVCLVVMGAWHVVIKPNAWLELAPVAGGENETYVTNRTRFVVAKARYLVANYMGRPEYRDYFSDIWIDLLHQSAEQGYVISQLKLAYMYSYANGVKRDERKAQRYFEMAAAQGNPGAQNGLGYRYSTGRGVAPDLALAKAYFEKAAAQGYYRAEYNLGLVYLEGQGAPVDYAKAAYWFGKLANRGHGNAQYQMGRLYEQGQGVEKNLATAYMWYTAALAKEVRMAGFRRAVVAASLTEDQRNKADQRVKERFE